MRINENLVEKPNHEHYMSCRTRKTVIDKFSKKVFFFTIIEVAIMFFFTLFGLWLSWLSLIPSLAGDEFSIGYIILQFTEIAGVFTLGLLGCGKKKVCTLWIFVINCLMTVGCIVGGFDASHFWIFAISVAGVFITYPSINAYLDYKQLMDTEGFPLFNHIVSDADDNPEFVSSYKEEYKKNQAENPFIDIPDKPSPDFQKVSESKGYMDDIPLNIPQKKEE